MKRLLGALALLLAGISPGHGQNAITQEGTVLQNSPMMFRGNNRARMGAGEKGDVDGKMIVGGFGVVGQVCSFSATTDKAGYHKLCFNPNNGTLVYDGTEFPIGATTIDGTSLALPDNTGLKGVIGDVGKMAIRLGYTTPGDGGLAIYNWSPTNCPLADNGAQVQPNGTGCWIADFSFGPPTPMVWGAKGDGTTNDLGPVQAAITAMAGKTLRLGPYRYCIGSPGILVTRPIHLIGETPSNVNETSATQYGLYACNTNIEMLTFTGAGGTVASSSIIENVFFNASAAGANTWGAGIVDDGVNNMQISHVRIWGACIGIDEKKSSFSRIDQVYITNGNTVQPGPDCGGIRVGHNTNDGNTTDLRLSDSTIDVPADWGLRIEDVGGMIISGVGVLFGKKGTEIAPGLGGATQAVNWLFASNSPLGDSACFGGMTIDTKAPGASVNGLSFTGTWTASTGGSPYFSNCTGDGVWIGNTGGGTVRGIYFVGHKSYNNFGWGMTIGQNALEVAIDSSSICNNSVWSMQHPETYGGILIGQYASNIAIRNNRISGHCVETHAGDNLQHSGVFITGDNSNLVIIGNDLRDNQSLGIGGAALLTGDNIIKNNTVADTKMTNVASSGQIVIPVQSNNIYITGTASPITQIANMWEGREVWMVVRDAATLTFSSSDTGDLRICNDKTVSAWTPIRLFRMPQGFCTLVGG
jgi:hypothetical protein